MKRLEAEIQEGGDANRAVDSNLLEFEEVVEEVLKKQPQN